MTAYADRDTILELVAAAGLKAMLVDTSGYKYSPDHKRLEQVSGRSGVGQTLTNLQVKDGMLYADDMVFPAVKTTVGAVVVFTASGRILAYNDELKSVPKTPRGGDVKVTFSQGVVSL